MSGAGSATGGGGGGAGSPLGEGTAPGVLNGPVAPGVGGTAGAVSSDGSANRGAPSLGTIGGSDVGPPRGIGTGGTTLYRRSRVGSIGMITRWSVPKFKVVRWIKAVAAISSPTPIRTDSLVIATFRGRSVTIVGRL